MRPTSVATLNTAAANWRALLANTPTDRIAKASEIFAIADLVASSDRLGLALTNPARSADDRAGLLKDVVERTGIGASVEVIDLCCGVVRGKLAESSDLIQVLHKLGRITILFEAHLAGQLTEVEQELVAVHEFFGREPVVRAAVSGRHRVPEHKRGEVLESVLGGHISESTLLLLSQAIRTCGSRPARSMVRELIEDAAREHSSQVALITSVQPLTGAQEDRLAAALERIYGMPVLLNINVRPDMVGGLHITVGDDVIDGSVLTRLNSAREALGA
ncbi:MAG: ATP synthase F1 subunit delta [Buchananella hordeovulneris]|nr:ATP synthase F1 subunit delta [Buchananella hordeovulneris]